MDTRQPFDSTPDHVAFGVEFNQDETIFAVGTEDGFRLYESATGKLVLAKDLEGSVKFASVLSSSRYVALIGGGPAPAYSPNKFVLWESETGTEPFKIEYNMIPIRACLTDSYYCTVFESGVVLYELDAHAHNNTAERRVGIYETAPNCFGLCQLGSRKLVMPGRSKGQIQIVDLATKAISILPAHESPIRMFTMNREESILATAGEKGTLIKLWSTEQEAFLMQFRRGLEQAQIFSIAFSPSGDQMAVTSDKSTIHVFEMPWREQSAGDEVSYRPDSHAGKRLSYPYGGGNVRDIPSPLSSSPGGAYGGSPPTPGKHAGSPSSATKVKFSTSSSEREPTEFLGPGTVQGWPEMPPKHQRTASRWSYATPGGVTDSSTDTDTPPRRQAQKYGNLGSLPLAPRFLKDTYSTMSCKFEMGNEPTRRRQGSKDKERAGGQDETASVTTVRTATTFSRQKENPWWPQGRPPKGKIAWIDDESLVVVSAGRDARWEKFVLGIDHNGQRGIERRGWKQYLEDEGVD
ncbi:uncharacterized protein PV09_04259 [Verruconis gallopava]|uniref:Anaphase-promoting complex subunit 4 WD40 domain-containing protein n=1 Tax=Verruconis gallopava TaxID=253628 RepID=A0A0D2ACD2_9PEZI|nr:uncharacterized protein PV09_04259 [Verruconis gallopava]KIW04503.1 hypothetical protein PV09_04259 [Verruconis gallopava]